MHNAKDLAGWRMPLRQRLGIPDSMVGEGVRVAVLAALVPFHREIAPELSARDVTWLGRDGKPYDAIALTSQANGKGEHDLQVVACAAGTGATTAGRYSGVAPGCGLVLSSSSVREGRIDRCEAARAGEEQLHSLMPLIERYGIAAVNVGRKGRLSGPLLPWQWDPERRACEELVHRGVVVVASAGNQPGSFCPQGLGPSVLCVGGLAWDAEGVAGPFHSPEGVTFEGKPVPDVLAPAEPVLVPSLVADDGPQPDGVPEGCTLTEGTSFASPVILGLVACLLQARPEAKPRAIMAALRAAARRAKPALGQHGIALPTWSGAMAAIDEMGGQPGATASPFEQYERVQAMTWPQRLTHAHDQPALTLLNCLPDGAPPDHVAALRHEFGRTADPRAGAAIVLLCRAGADGKGEHELLDAAMHDASPLVVAAALEVVRSLGDGVHRYRGRLIELINCPDLALRHEALRAVEAAPDEAYVNALVHGMPMDLGRWPTSAFFARRRCLKAITGQTHWPQARGMLPGECVFSEYWVSMQRLCMEAWQNGLAEGRPDLEAAE